MLDGFASIKVQTILGLVLVMVALTISRQNTSADLTAPHLRVTLAASLPPVTTESRFTSKFTEESEDIPFKTVYQDDPNAEAGTQTVAQDGELGKITRTIKITYYQGREYQREVTATKTISPTNKIISRGTKIVWHTLDTPDGQISYWEKLHVWATDYTPFCSTCSGTGRTSLGLQAGKGIAAVDPSVIKLGSKFYVPGYGTALAGDTGGGVNGNMVDLGFDNDQTKNWTSHFVDIYIMN